MAPQLTRRTQMLLDLDPATARRLRREAGLTLADVAREVGVHPFTVRRWELEEHPPRGENRIRYARFLAALRDAQGTQ